MTRMIPIVTIALSLMLVPSAVADQAPNTAALGLGGYSPVSYFEGGPAVGSPKFPAVHDGVTYLFRSDAERARFTADPARFLPAYGGWCAYGMAVEAIFPVNPTSYRIIDGRLNLFLRNEEVDALALWDAGDVSSLRGRADAYWTSLNTSRPSRAYLNHFNLPAHGVAIEGYSPVSYFTAGRAERGTPEHTVEHGGVTYHLTSAAQVALFEADPQRYVPAYGGWCAFGMSVQDKFPVDPKRFAIVNGRLLLFLRNDGIDAGALWEQGDEAELLGKANAHWATVTR